MAKSPFAFLRGSAAVMASDLSGTPVTGLVTQLCGDCHLSNFGLFATPERHLVFDLNDFDETLPGPWEWDVKRLATSFVVAARENNFSEIQAKEFALRVLGAYRGHLRECAAMAPMDVWYQRMEWQTVIEETQDPKSRKVAERMEAAARKRVIEHLFPKIVKSEAGHLRLVDEPPMLFHVPEEDMGERVRYALAEYRLTLADDRRVLVDRYHLVDFAVKVVGVGSVGTRCYILLLMSVDNDPMILQVKEARRSVLEPYTQKCRYENQGERVVVGPTAHAVVERYLPGMGARQARLRLLRAAIAGHEVLRAARARHGRAFHPLRGSLRVDARPRPRESGRRRGDQRIPRQERPFRPGDGEVRGGICGPDRT